MRDSSCGLAVGVNALGFGGFTIPAIARVWVGKDVPIVMGFPAYGQGPFEDYGIRSTVPLLASFLVVCIVEGVAGWLMCRSHPTARPEQFLRV